MWKRESIYCMPENIPIKPDRNSYIPRQCLNSIQVSGIIVTGRKEFHAFTLLSKCRQLQRENMIDIAIIILK